jgi:DnaJ-class molecular chaperone
MDKYSVCPECRGEGKIVHRGLSVWTESDRFEDPESFEAMMEGRYDVTCDRCNGLRVVTTESELEFNEQRENHFEMLREQGIYPGSKDWF